VSDEQLRSRRVLCIGSEIIGLHRRCRALRENGWLVLSSANGHDGIVRFAAERVDVVVLDVNSDAAETAVIAGELKRTRANVPVIMLVTEEQTLAEGVLEIADAVVLRSDQSKLLKTLDSLQRAGRS
jgi:AmiR/NasT family two-component response regulator